MRAGTRVKMLFAVGLYASCAAMPVGALDGRPSVTWERTVNGTNTAGATVYGLAHIFGNAVEATPEDEYSKCIAHRWLDELFPPAGVYCQHRAMAWVGIGEPCPAPPNDLQWVQDRFSTNALEVTPRRVGEIAHDFPANEWRRVQHAKGYRAILVNGECTFEDGECTGSTPGQLLRHGRS